MMHTPIRLALLIGPVLPRPVPALVIDALVGARVVVTSRTTDPNGQSPTHGRSGFELRFSLSGRAKLLSFFQASRAEAPLVLRVVLVATVNARREPIFDGFVTDFDLQPGTDGEAALMLRGRDLTAVMDMADRRGVAFAGAPAEERVATILSRYAVLGIAPLIVPAPHSDHPSEAERVAFQDGTDYDYLCQLANEVGYVFHVTPGPVVGMSVAYWGPEVKIGVPQPPLYAGHDALNNVESLSFRFANATSTTPVALLRNESNPVPVAVPVEAIDGLNPPLGRVLPDAWRIDPLRGVAHLSMPLALSRVMARQSAAAECVAAEGTLDVVRYGRLLKARQLVSVRGAGPQYSGLYYVRGVTHDIRRGTYKQSFSLSRRALNAPRS